MGLSDILKVGESLLSFFHDDFQGPTRVDFSIYDQLVKLFFEGEFFVEELGLFYF